LCVLAILQPSVAANTTSDIKATPETRKGWASTHGYDGLFDRYCESRAQGEENKIWFVSCNTEGFASMSQSLFKQGSSLANEAYVLGFTRVHLSDGQTANWDFVLTATGLQKPTLDSLPIDPTPHGRREVGEMYLGKVANCNCTLGGDQADVIYLSCPWTTELKVATIYSKPEVAKNLSARGFRAIIYSDGDHNWPAMVSANGFARSPEITSEQLLNQYGIKTAKLVAREEQAAQGYADFVESVARKLLPYAVARDAKRSHSATWTSQDWAAYNNALNEETAYLGELKGSSYVQRPSFWVDLKSYAQVLVGQGKWEPYAGNFARSYVTTGSTDKDAHVTAALLQEIDAVKTKINSGARANP
jgi:hypothetical protein